MMFTDFGLSHVCFSKLTTACFALANVALAVFAVAKLALANLTLATGSSTSPS